MLLRVSLVGSVVTYGGLYWFFPLLREDTQQLLLAGKRLANISFTAAHIGYNYLDGITQEKHTKNAQLLYNTLKVNGGLYVKLGQVLAMMDLVIPEEYSEAMKPMLNEATVSEYESVKSVIETDLQSKIEDLFESFDKVPIASASLAQVHKATLKSGESAAVKVQHKWVKQQFPGDIRVLEFLAILANTLFNDFDYMWIIEDLKKSIAQEMNFTIEAENAQRCFSLFQNDPYIKVPKVYTNLSSSRVLTMDFMKGVRICDIEEIKKMGVKLEDVAYTLSRAFNEMIFVHGFVHCDPHPGNIFVSVNESGKPLIIILDHGLYRELSKEKLASYTNMWKSIINKDEESMKKYAAELGVFSLYPLLAGMMVGRTWDEIMDEGAGLERLRNPRASLKDKEAIRMHAQQWRNEINQVLGRMDNEIVLLFKTFEWLRANDAALGAPINTIEIIAEYLNRDEGFWTKTWTRLKLWVYKKIV